MKKMSKGYARSYSSTRRLGTKKNVERKKTLCIYQVGKPISFSRMRRLRLFSSNHPCDITISTERLTQEQINLLKELEAKGRIPIITWITSSFNSFDDRIKYALLYLHSDEAESMGCKIKRGYDYAWIKIALDRGPLPDRYADSRFMSMPKFVDYIKSLGFTDIAGSKTLNKAIEPTIWHSKSNSLTFYGLSLNPLERKRRNFIAWKFLEIMNEI